MHAATWRPRVVAALIAASVAFAWAPAQQAPRPPGVTQAERATVGPTLPFADNPDPTQCGIPQPMGEGTTGILDGHYQGRLIEADVILYGSHLRQAIRGTLPTGSRVDVVLYQSNPALDYYLVRGTVDGSRVEGWVPAPFLIDVRAK